MSPAETRSRASSLNAGQTSAAPGPITLVTRGYARFASGPSDSLARVSVGRFPNGELRAEVPACVEGRRCVLIGSISPPAGNLERLTIVAHALRRAGAVHVTALLPYLAYARQDRGRCTESLGLAWVGGLLRASGVDEIVCVDIHSADASGVLGLPVRSLSPAGLLVAALPQSLREAVTFVAPDEGAIDRCSALAQAAGVERPIVWARKRRTSTGVEHLGLIGSPARQAVIVDDILDTGGTLMSCCEQLRAAGVKQTGVIVTHGLFTGKGWRTLLAEGCRPIWITDTVLSRRRPAETIVVPVASLVAPVLSGMGN
ncbi:MAG: ribose-phosphate diphosphokinase [Solirubrobacteraceae bacterium]